MFNIRLNKRFIIIVNHNTNNCFILFIETIDKYISKTSIVNVENFLHITAANSFLYFDKIIVFPKLFFLFLGTGFPFILKISNIFFAFVPYQASYPMYNNAIVSSVRAWINFEFSYG